MQMLCLRCAAGRHLANGWLACAEPRCTTKVGAFARMRIVGILRLADGRDRQSSSSWCYDAKCVGRNQQEEEEQEGGRSRHFV